MASNTHMNVIRNSLLNVSLTVLVPEKEMLTYSAGSDPSHCVLDCKRDIVVGPDDFSSIDICLFIPRELGPVGGLGPPYCR